MTTIELDPADLAGLAEFGEALGVLAAAEGGAFGHHGGGGGGDGTAEGAGEVVALGQGQGEGADEGVASADLAADRHVRRAGVEALPVRGEHRPLGPARDDHEPCHAAPDEALGEVGAVREVEEGAGDAAGRR